MLLLVLPLRGVLHAAPLHLDLLQQAVTEVEGVEPGGWGGESLEQELHLPPSIAQLTAW